MQITVEPEISEWGNPAAVMGGRFAGEYIACIARTEGTETSKYLQEEKVNNDSLSSGERKGKSLNL